MEQGDTGCKHQAGLATLRPADSRYELNGDKQRDVCSGSRATKLIVSTTGPLIPRSPTCERTSISVAQGHVWTAPGWQELSSRLQHWSVQPCVRPLDAVHMTAGHNALRGSGPGQKHAFDNALALVGCPDRRIDRLCITCCSPSQPSHHAGCPARSRSRRKCGGFLVSLALGHHRPGHPGDLVGERDGRDLRRVAAPATT